MWNTVGFRSHCLQRPQSADAQHDFLPNALVQVAAIQLIGDIAGIPGAGFRGMLVSSRYSCTRPTSMRQTFRKTSVSPSGTLTSAFAAVWVRRPE